MAILPYFTFNFILNEKFYAMEQSCSFLFFSSCNEIKEQNEIFENKISSPTSLPLAASSAEFMALTESSKENSLLTDQCQCDYKILSVDLPPLATGAARNIVELFSNDECDGPFGTPVCPLFTTSFTSDGLCKVPFGNCHQDWNDLMEDYQPFNCLIDAFSGFYTLNFSSYQTGVNGLGCGGFQFPGNPEITIAIRCQKESGSSCEGTDTNIYTLDTNNYEEIGYFVTGGKCGCVPHFLKFQNPEDQS